MPFIEYQRYSQVWCSNPEHNPPSHLVQEPGKYSWQCPGCGHITDYYVPVITT